MSLQLAGPLAWQDHALCAGAGLDLFFPDGTDTQRAKSFCNVCPVWAECLAYAIDREEAHGVWGGLTSAERKRLRQLCERFAAHPDDLANAKDVRWLVGGGMPEERLACLLGCSVETIAGLGRCRRRRAMAR